MLNIRHAIERNLIEQTHFTFIIACARCFIQLSDIFSIRCLSQT